MSRIRLNGRQVLQLPEALLEVVSEPAAALLPADDINWGVAADLLGLDPDEREILMSHRRDGIPRRELHQVLGWDSARVERARRRLDRKLHRAEARRVERKRHGSSRRPWFLEDLWPGVSVYALDELGEEFREVMAAEFQNIFVRNVSSGVPKP